MITGQSRPTFIDLFAGAGGLSLGLMQAGMRGLFAIEKEPNAFATLRANLIDAPVRHSYDWPDWLPRQPLDIGAVIGKYEAELEQLRGYVDVLAGGPPCQGFSSAGRRRSEDPRNRLFELYARFAEAVRPRFLVFENVPGIAIPFGKVARKERNPRGLGRPVLAYSQRIANRLDQAGYHVIGFHEHAVDFGVPQRRTRYLMLGFRKDLGVSLTEEDTKRLLADQRDQLLDALGIDWPVTLSEAISDLSSTGRKIRQSYDSERFQEVQYQGPETAYQRSLRHGMKDTESPNSMRLANHRPETIRRFEQILRTCRKGVRLTAAEREQFGTGKVSITPLDADQPSQTVTSLPDDFVHYSEPRILTVRECARIQSFPDWFKFEGNYTTGGPRRRFQVPRYTQVANAVPPLMARAIGLALLELHRRSSSRSTSGLQDPTQPSGLEVGLGSPSRRPATLLP